MDPLNLDPKNQGQNIPVGLPSSPNKIWGKLVQGFLSHDRKTNKHTNSYYNSKYIEDVDR